LQREGVMITINLGSGAPLTIKSEPKVIKGERLDRQLST
jgi:hypothetical protein